jgi:hypothetical protein
MQTQVGKDRSSDFRVRILVVRRSSVNIVTSMTALLCVLGGLSDETEDLGRYKGQPESRQLIKDLWGGLLKSN